MGDREFGRVHFNLTEPHTTKLSFLSKYNIAIYGRRVLLRMASPRAQKRSDAPATFNNVRAKKQLLKVMVEWGTETHACKTH